MKMFKGQISMVAAFICCGCKQGFGFIGLIGNDQGETTEQIFSKCPRCGTLNPDAILLSLDGAKKALTFMDDKEYFFMRLCNLEK